MATYSIENLGRRDILRLSAVLAGSSAVSLPRPAGAEAAVQRTPDQILGPFYPLKELPQTADLTRVPGPPRSRGRTGDQRHGPCAEPLGEPVRDAKVEIWQANAHGRYTHPSDTNSAPLDPSFEGSAVLTTDTEGRYFFKTIKPAAYPAGPNRMRPAHIHFQVSGRQDKIVTQMYFAGDPHNATDPFLNSVGGAERQALLVRKFLAPSRDLEPESKMVIFDVVLYNG